MRTLPAARDKSRLFAHPFFFAALSFVLSSLLFCPEVRISSDDLPFDFAFRALHPGEIILVTLKENPAIKKAVIRFLDKEYDLENGETISKRLAFIGLDLNLKPQSYEMDIFVEKIDGRKESIKRKFLVSVKEFPVKRMWIKDAFVTPPPEVEERIRSEADLLRLIYSRITLEWLGEGNFILPLQGKISPNFGQRRFYNNIPRSSHSGIDITAPQGTSIMASNSGKVVLSQDLYYSGKTVILDHGLGLFTFYCHLSRILVRTGELAKKGDVLGKTGSTGRSTGPHLHWGVKIFDSRVDPFSLLSLQLD